MTSSYSEIVYSLDGLEDNIYKTRDEKNPMFVIGFFFIILFFSFLSKEY